MYATKTLSYAEHSPASLKRIGAALSQGKTFDTRTRLQVILDSESVGKQLSPRITPKEFKKINGFKTDGGRLFPLGGLSNRSTVYCNNYGDYLLFDSDQWGLRNPAQAHQNSPSDLLVIGDSFSMGHCVKNDIASLLRQRGMTALSLAYSGNGPLIELATLREYGTQVSPKVVLWVYYEGNDLRDLNSEKSVSLLMRYLEPDFSQGVISKQPQIDALLEDYIQKARAKKIAKTSWLAVVKLSGTRIFVKKSISQLRTKKVQAEADLVLFEKILKQAQDDISSWDGQIVFVYLPDWTRFAYPESYGDVNHWLDYRDDVLSLVQRLNIPIVDIAETMALRQDPVSYFPYRFRGHYTEQGYDIVVEQINETLSESRKIQDQLPTQNKTSSNMR